MKPRMTPRPDSDAMFLKAIFEGIAGVEALAYERLVSLGSPPLPLHPNGGRRGEECGLDSDTQPQNAGTVSACGFGRGSGRHGAACADRRKIGGCDMSGGPLEIAGLDEVAERFDAFLIDQFGVLRDGKGPYPGAVDTLIRLKQAGKTIIILSNSGKRSAENDRRLAALGFDRTSWDWFLTSGEVAWRNPAEGKRAGRRRCEPQMPAGQPRRRYFAA